MGYPAPAPKYIGPANRNGGPGNKPIKRIVIHCTVSPCATGAENIARYFKTTSTPASAHYVVDAKTTIQSLYDSYVGFHAPPNGNSLGIELCCNLHGQGKGHWSRRDHKKMLRRAARLTAELCLAYDVPAVRLTPAEMRAGKQGLCGHNDVRDAWGQTTHWDPGPHFPWKWFVQLVQDEIEQIKCENKPDPKPKKRKKRNTRVRRARKELAEALELLDDAVTKGKRTGKVRKQRDKIRKAYDALPEQ